MPSVISQEYAIVPVGSIQPHPKNPRKGDVAAIDESIQANGFYGAVLVQKSSGFIIAGRHRWDRAQAAGIAEIPAILADVDDLAAERIIAADNRTSDVAGYDDLALAQLLDGIRIESGTLEGTGYDQDALDLILKQAGDAVLAAAQSADSGAEAASVPQSVSRGSGKSRGRQGTLGLKKFGVVIDCADQQEQEFLIQCLASQGLKARAITL